MSRIGRHVGGIFKGLQRNPLRGFFENHCTKQMEIPEGIYGRVIGESLAE